MKIIENAEAIDKFDEEKIIVTLLEENEIEVVIE